jgi:hypothetical protein
MVAEAELAGLVAFREIQKTASQEVRNVGYSVSDITKEEVIAHFLASYKAHLPS